MRRSIALPLALAAALSATPALAQQHVAHGAGRHGAGHGSAAPAADPARPYAALADRRIKALSETQVADLLAGRGMALALAAELNGYPGPLHVLEHADALGLTPEQRARAEGLRAAMAAEAQAIGARIVALEAELDALFARGEAEAGRLGALAAMLGALGGRLREAHLTAHVGMREALSPEHRAAYARLRGYGPR